MQDAALELSRRKYETKLLHYLRNFCGLLATACCSLSLLFRLPAYDYVVEYTHANCCSDMCTKSIQTDKIVQLKMRPISLWFY